MKRSSQVNRWLALTLAAAVLLQSAPGLLLAFDAEFDTGHQVTQPVANPPERPDSNPGNEDNPPGNQPGTKDPEGPDTSKGDDPEKPDKGDKNPGQGNDYGEPVNLYSGDFEYDYQDLYVPAPGFPLKIQRTFHTHNRTPGAFGNGWSTIFDQRLDVVKGEDDAVVLIQRRTDGVRLRFLGASLASGTLYAPPSGVRDTLERAGSSFALKRPWKNTYLFDGSGRLISMSDLNGNTMTVTRDVRGRVTRVTDAVGRALTFTYTPLNKVAAVTDPAGRTFRYAYDVKGNLIQVADPAGRSIRYSYDLKNRIASITDGSGNTWLTNTYDDQDRVISQVVNGGNFTYSYSNGGTTVTDPLGNRTSHFFDSEGRMIRADDPSSSFQTWDVAGRMVRARNRLGRETAYEYDAAGNVVAVSDPRQPPDDHDLRPALQQADSDHRPAGGRSPVHL